MRPRQWKVHSMAEFTRHSLCGRPQSAPVLATILPRVDHNRATRGQAAEEAATCFCGYLLRWSHQPLVAPIPSPPKEITWLHHLGQKGYKDFSRMLLSWVCALVNTNRLHCWVVSLDQLNKDNFLSLKFLAYTLWKICKDCLTSWLFRKQCISRLFYVSLDQWFSPFFISWHT